MAINDPASSDLNYADTLWEAADTLRGQVDAAEYKHVVLGLLFLKYVSDSFESRRDELRGELERDGTRGEQLDRVLESRDEYTAERVFWVPLDMNLAIDGIEARLGDRPVDTFLRDQRPDLKADFVLASPIFNVSDWSGRLLYNGGAWL